MKHLFLFLVLALSIPAFAAVPMQITQDRAENNRLVIDGKTVFISGMNIAWNNFGNDVGDQPVNINAFVNQFKQIKGAGGNAVRWWLHTDLRNEPKMNSDGSVNRIGTKTIDNIRQVLDSAYNYGIMVSLCLFSFDLLQLDGKDADKVAINKKFLTVPANLDTYINIVLKPMLEAVGNHPAIMCWEVFNEPEGMSSDAGGWADGDKVPMSDILRFTARIAAVVHDKTLKMASTGIHEFGKMKTWYSNDKLKAAAGSDPLASKAYLDFYMAHYYPQYMGTIGSPFHNPASFWEMDRPILIGEFPAQSWGPGTGYSNIQQGTAMTITAAYEYAYDNGYCGAMSWSMTESDPAKFGSFTTTKPALENLYAKHKADIEIKDVEIVVPTGDLAMKLAITNLPQEGTASDGGPWNELSTLKDANFSGKTNLTFEMFIEPGSGTNLTIVPVLKDANWTWSPAQSKSFSLAEKPQGEWFTVTIPVSTFQASEAGKTFNPASVKEFVIQYYAKNTPYTGTILFDNFKVDGTVLFDFNEAGSEWNSAVEGASVSLVARSSTTPVISQRNASTLNLSAIDFSKAKVYDISGKRVFANSLSELKNGVYIVKVNGISKKFVVKNR